jgi:hypothetical protein
MKFSEMTYTRPDAEAVKARIAEITGRLAEAKSYEEARAAFLEMDQEKRHFMTASELVGIRHMIDTRDEFYDGESTYFNNIGPEIQEPMQLFNLELIKSPFRAEFEKEFGSPEFPVDIYNVEIKNIRASSYCSIVRILNQGGTKIHDVLMDGLYDTSDECPSLNHGCNVVKIGDLHPYAERHANDDETYNITIRNVYACGVNALKLTGGMSNLVLEGIECKKGTKMFQDDRGKPLGEKKNVKLG